MSDRETNCQKKPEKISFFSMLGGVFPKFSSSCSHLKKVVTRLNLPFQFFFFFFCFLFFFFFLLFAFSYCRSDYEDFFAFKQQRKQERAASRPKHLVILGGGFGGLEAVSEARSLLLQMPEKVRNSWKITVIERRSHWTGGWAHQYVMTDRHSLEELSPSYDDCRYGAHFVRDEILEVRLDTRQVVCRDKGVITADYLLLALGMQAQATPLVENKLWNICNPEHATKLKEAIEQIKPGDSVKQKGVFFFFSSVWQVLVCITRVPYQCPPAPQEFAFLIDDVLRRRGIRDQVRLAISLPMPNVVPVENPTRVREILKQK